MNAGPAESPEPVRPKRAAGWSRERWLMLVALVFAAQVGFIFALGERQFGSPRAAVNVPTLKLADDSDELLALDDPTLFALPHVNDFASAVWLQMPAEPQPPFRWAEFPQPPPLTADNLGAVFRRFMRTNQLAAPPLDFKPEPKLSEPVLPLPPAFAANSTLQIAGDLAKRKWLNPISLTNWPYADVIATSRVQVLVDEAGDVVSAVLLPSDNPEEAASHYNDADQYAVELARAARFAPASHLTVGRLIFNWRAVPPPAPNPPGGS